MKMKTIWIWAVVFGLVASASLYFTLLSRNKETHAVSSTVDQARQATSGQDSIKNNQQANANAQGTNGSINLPIAANKRAITIPVNEVQGVAGHLRAGDLVDVIMTTPQQSEQAAAKLLLQGVKVLSLDSAAVITDKGGGDKLYHTVTLEVSAEEGVPLSLGVQKGAGLQLMLRPANDSSSKVATEPVSFDSLMKGAAPK